MERLTRRNGDGKGYIPCHWKESAEAVDKGQNRLADIEDILGDTYDLNRLRELVDADKAGKCIIAPCALGDTIWFKTYSKNGTICKGVQPHIVKEIRVYAVVDGEYIDCVIPSWTFGESTFLTRESALEKEKHDEQKESSQD